MRKAALSLLPLALLAAPLAMAVPQGQTPGNSQAPAASKAKPTLDSATLHKFAAAYEDVQQERTKYMAKLANTKDKKKQTAIQKQAEQDIKAHIRKHMPVSEYESVGKEINTNTEARKKLIKILQADQKKSAPPAQGGGGQGA